MKWTCLTGAVTEKDGSDLALLLFPGCKGGAERQRDRPADNAGRGNESSVDCDDVHRTALAAAISRRSAGDFGHQAIDIGSLCDGMTVRAVTPEHIIIRAQLAAHPDGHGFLADAQM